MSAEEKARLAELEAENQRLKQQHASFAEAEKQRKTAADHASHLAFAEGLIKEGKLLPAQKDLVISTLDFMAGQEQAIEFGEGEAKKPLLEVLKTDLFSKLPKQIEFAELTGGQCDEDASVNFAAPDGYATDQADMRRHQRIQAHMRQNHVDYVTAALAIGE